MDEPDPLPLSALQHRAYCPRQCGLIHLEQAFHDNLQLAAPAWCLEEMTGRAVTDGALFHATSERRRVVPITPALREAVAETSRDVRALLASQRLPPPTADVRRCNGCSLRERCQPEALARLRDGAAAGTLFEPDAP